MTRVQRGDRKPPTLIQQNMQTYGTQGSTFFDDIPDTIFQSAEQKRISELEQENQTLYQKLQTMSDDYQSSGYGKLVIGSGSITVDSTGLNINVVLDETSFFEFAEQVGKLKTAYQWVVGDLAVYSQSAFGEGKYKRLAEILGERETTIEDWAYVCRNVQKPVRAESLTLTHHRLVCSLEPELQKHFLGVCAEYKLSSTQFESLLKIVGTGVPTGEALESVLKAKRGLTSPIEKLGSDSLMLRSTVLKKIKSANKRERKRWIDFAEQQAKHWLELIDVINRDFPSGG